MKNSTLINVIIVVDILYILFLSFLIIFSLKERKRDLKLSQQVLGEELNSFVEEEEKKDVEEKSFFVFVCNESNCVELSSENCVEDGIVNRSAVYVEVLDKVLPFFEKEYGGKAYAKNRAGGFLYWKEDNIPDLTNIFNDVYNAFDSQTDTVVQVVIKDLPGTDGKYAPRYIEVDNSKQKLYSWVDGKVDREILLSGPKSGYEVYGVFPINDKGIAPIAPGGKYMPYWLGFYHSPSQSSWYGLHALIWWYDEEGNKVYEPVSNIGLRKSAGCIRMLLEDAKYLYNIFERGDLILIHE